MASSNKASGGRTLTIPDNSQETLRVLDVRPSFSFGGSVGDEVITCPTLRSKLQARESPFLRGNYHGGGFTSDNDRVLLQSVYFADRHSAGNRSQDRLEALSVQMKKASFKNAAIDDATSDLLLSVPKYAIRAGARKRIYFDPKETRMAIVTAGAICPGQNDIIRAIVTKAFDYGVPEGHILGIRNGFRGFTNRTRRPMVLTHSMVKDCHLEGGTLLGTSNDPADIREIIKRLDLWKIDQLFVIGGTGGNAAAYAIQRECERCNVPTAVVGVPKSIDNDMLLFDKCFGFDTAVEGAQAALMAAKVEAASGYRGIGIVKLMGRRSGFIAVQASLASGVVDAVLIPEVPFRLEGEKGLLAYVEKIMARDGHAVICVAEAAAQDLMHGEGPRRLDAAGNPVLSDVGPWLKAKFKAHFQDADIKYIDPSCLIRSIPASSQDRIYCRMLGHGAVHAAFAGYTGVTVGLINTHYCYIPIPMVIQAPRTVDPHGELWARLRSAIGQPSFVDDEDEEFCPE
uniref:Phosphofructokinase domain-containing protein n=2 Tax=Auxenochlorella protothecoides TaxID=3075 RepID=A0A1D2A0K5_AUXPR